ITSIPSKDGEPRTFSRNEMMMIVLTAGTSAGFERIKKLEISEAAYYEIVTKLTPQDIEHVNFVWDIFEAYKDKINSRIAKITGVKPSKIERRPFGELKGGWIPLTVDYASPRVVKLKGGGTY